MLKLKLSMSRDGKKLKLDLESRLGSGHSVTMTVLEDEVATASSF